MLLLLLFSDTVKLEGGAGPMEGVAMYSLNSTWGSICDDHPDATTWPSLLCRNLGYDRAKVREVWDP